MVYFYIFSGPGKAIGVLCGRLLVKNIKVTLHEQVRYRATDNNF